MNTDWPHGDNIYNHLEPGIRITLEMGSGANATAYSLSNGQVLKCLVHDKKFHSIDEFKNEFDREVSMQTTFYMMGIGPQLYHSFCYKDGKDFYGIIVMEKVETLDRYFLRLSDSTLTSIEFIQTVLNKLQHLLGTMCGADLVHGDMMLHNMYVITDSNDNLIRLGLLDFGNASHKHGGYILLDFIAFLRSLSALVDEGEFKELIHLEQITRTTFMFIRNCDLEFSYKALNPTRNNIRIEHLRLLDKYIETI